jgi:hypothetical protein
MWCMQHAGIVVVGRKYGWKDIHKWKVCEWKKCGGMVGYAKGKVCGWKVCEGQVYRLKKVCGWRGERHVKGKGTYRVEQMCRWKT